MPATRSRASTEQPAEVAAEEVKQVQEEGSEIGDAPVQQDVVKPAEAVAAEPEAAAEAVEPVVPVTEAATNGSAEVADTNGSEAVAGTNGSAVESNGIPAEVAAVDESAAAEPEVADGKRKSEAGGEGDVVPDSTDVKKQKVADAPAEAEEPVVEASA